VKSLRKLTCSNKEQVLDRRSSKKKVPVVSSFANEVPVRTTVRDESTGSSKRGSSSSLAKTSSCDESV